MAITEIGFFLYFYHKKFLFRDVLGSVVFYVNGLFCLGLINKKCIIKLDKNVP